ncbi:MAG TPA: hypothetical protein VFX47_06860 [Gammaproteobacteria bacterium]|nr:hypothetical protein [Gammaproteobacteria bacterium]
MTNRRHRLNLIWLCLLVALSAAPLRAAQDSAPPVATDSRTPAPVATTAAKPVTASLSKVQVTGVKQLIRTLQTVKVALNQPFSTSQDKANVVVCRIIHGHGELSVEARMGAILECGTNSWFTARHDKCQQNAAAADCAANAPTTSVYERKGAWHSMRTLNLQQVMALRKLLGKLPPPDSDRKIVVEIDAPAKH